LDIIVDIDDTIADLLTVWLSRYNADYNDHLTRDDITAWDLTKFVKPECGVKIYDYLKDEHIYDEIEPIPGALMGVTRLRGMGHHILFVTANIHREKWEWLKRHGFLSKTWTSQDYICCFDKHLIKADAIIDDKPETVDRFPGLAILFDRPHNQVYNALWRAHSWSEVIELICKYQPCPDEAVEVAYRLREDEKGRLYVGGSFVPGVGENVPVTVNENGGKQSYGEWNWRRIPTSDHLNHALTHIFAYLAGDKQDDHIGHALCRLMFAQSMELTPGESERMKPE
jgi:5'-nucleotidase